eukprot:NODE_1578_length_1898_cov_43.937465_g1337_i0.p1 GENE.NODE_1578_length_1898_cov_43.937465_g1337_i0~~NODE_1578_length_1898_cov_43.937465_g1337_i0.p1  ORF type:complete len:582 (+),score=105.01 NODE_1578_length_1898_cov_43.937465_g1337_i0:202-1746(+)
MVRYATKNGKYRAESLENVFLENGTELCRTKISNKSCGLVSNTEKNSRGLIINRIGVRVISPSKSEEGRQWLLGLEETNQNVNHLWTAFFGYYHGDEDKDTLDGAHRKLKTESLNMPLGLNPNVFQEVEYKNLNTKRLEVSRVFEGYVKDGVQMEDIPKLFHNELQNSKSSFRELRWFSSMQILYSYCMGFLEGYFPIPMRSESSWAALVINDLQCDLAIQLKELLDEHKCNEFYVERDIAHHQTTIKKDPRFKEILSNLKQYLESHFPSLELLNPRIGKLSGVEGNGYRTFNPKDYTPELSIAEAVKRALNQNMKIPLPECEKHWSDCINFVLSSEKLRYKTYSELNEDEKALIHLYTREQPKLYKIMNSDMREGDPSIWKEIIYYLNEAISKLPRHSGMIYRTLTVGPYKDGDVIVWPAFSSCSYNLEKSVLASQLAGNSEGLTLISIECKFGKKIEDFSQFEEAEVLLAPNTKFICRGGLKVGTRDRLSKIEKLKGKWKEVIGVELEELEM